MAEFMHTTTSKVGRAPGDVQRSRTRRQQQQSISISPLKEVKSCSIPFSYHDGICYNVTGVYVDPLYCL